MITGIGAFGDYNKRPLCFQKTSIILNGSFYELKLEIFVKDEDIRYLLDFYENFSKYGEWGEKFVKPIAWMEIKCGDKVVKSKEFLKLEEFLKGYVEYEITIYFETFIEFDPFESDFFESSDYGTNAMGGLYYVIDMDLYIEEGEEIYENLLYTGDRFENYKNENLKKYSKETGVTARELIKNNEGSKFVKEGSVG